MEQIYKADESYVLCSFFVFAPEEGSEDYPCAEIGSADYYDFLNSHRCVSRA